MIESEDEQQEEIESRVSKDLLKREKELHQKNNSIQLKNTELIKQVQDLVVS
jgi:hypothetical protein